MALPVDEVFSGVVETWSAPSDCTVSVMPGPLTPVTCGAEALASWTANVPTPPTRRRSGPSGPPRRVRRR